MDLKIGILASHKNEVVDTIVEKFSDSIGAIICKTSDEDEILDVFEKSDVNLVVLVDYFRRVSDDFISRYPGRILNVHPSLLPKFGGEGMFGRAVHEAVIASGDEKSGVTIHVVEGDYDIGEIVAQRKIDAKGNVEDLERDVCEAEKELVCEVLEKFRQYF